MQVEKILQNVPMFATLEDAELSKVAELATVKGYLAGIPLFSAGDPSDSFYVIARGRVTIQLPAAPGVPARSISLGTGKFFGEMGVISGTARNADAVVEEDAVLVRISQGAFDKLTAIDENIAEKVMVAYMVRASEAEERQDKAEKSLSDPKCMLFYGTGGGAGASFLVANTALKVRDLTKKSVLILDLDMQTPSQHLYLNSADPGPALHTVLAKPQPDPITVKEVAKELHYGVDVLGGPIVANPNDATPEKLGKLLVAALKAYDYVLVDTTSALTRTNEFLFRQADAVHLVFSPDIVSVSRAVPVVRWFEEQKTDNKLRLVMNKFTPAEEGFRPGAIETKFGKPVMGRVEFEHTLGLGALNEGVPLVKRNPHSTAAVDLNRFARQMISLQTGTPHAERPFSLWNMFG